MHELNINGNFHSLINIWRLPFMTVFMYDYKSCIVVMMVVVHSNITSRYCQADIVQLLSFEFSLQDSFMCDIRHK